MDRTHKLTRRGFPTSLLAGASLAATGCFGKRPNVLWVTSEDNGPFLGCYGDAYATTPNLDRMAAEGILYENAHATYPVCAPARCSLITGMYPQSLGAGHMRSANPTPSRVRMFPALLREAGYYCTNNSKQDYNTEAADDVWDESSENATYRNRKNGQPFFHVRNFTTTHESSLFKQHRPRHDPARVALPPYHPDTPAFRSDWAQYYDHIERLDVQVGEVLGELAADGLAGNTIVFYFSDHGGILPRSKRSVHESGTRVPLIVRFPEALRALAPDGPDRRTDRLVSFVDFAPSVLNLLEQKIPDYMQGMPFLGPKTKARREYVYMARDRMGPSPDLKRAVRNERFRYVRNYLPQMPAAQFNTYEIGIPSWAELWKLYQDGALNKAQRLMFELRQNEELYDTEADPHEVSNLADQPEFEDTLRRLREAHLEHTLRIRDTAFLPEIEMHRLAKSTTPYEFARDDAKYPLQQILKVVELASARDTTNLPLLARDLSHENTAIQYWAAIGCRLLEAEAEPARVELQEAALASPSDAVRMAAAEVLCWIGGEETGLKTLTEYLNDDREWVRFTAACHLGWLGPKAVAAKEILERHMERETESYPKQAAGNALRYIEGKFTPPL